ncbi:GNAT family N-acetyltransferase [Nocardia sp. NPDC060256]|uniref:GNAT family N-acetyltransferase n=1 Tax=unclassified Nocardia TaxID=2637762 RepID=UPI0036490407
MNIDEAGLKVVRYDAAEALRWGDEIKAIYIAAHRSQLGNPWYSPGKFWERIEQLYAPVPGFELVACLRDDRMVGYAFGTPYPRPREVRAKAMHVFPELAAEAADAPVYIFREFSVHPDHKGQGYARMIHHASLSQRPERLAYLLVRVGNSARSLYEKWGWQVIGRVQPFADLPVMDEMVKQLP